MNHILKTSGGKEGKKILVIENEVGEEGIDHELLIREGNEEIVLMNNGYEQPLFFVYLFGCLFVCLFVPFQGRVLFFSLFFFVVS